MGPPSWYRERFDVDGEEVLRFSRVSYNTGVECGESCLVVDEDVPIEDRLYPCFDFLGKQSPLPGGGRPVRDSLLYDNPADVLW